MPVAVIAVRDIPPNEAKGRRGEWGRERRRDAERSDAETRSRGEKGERSNKARHARTAAEPSRIRTARRTMACRSLISVIELLVLKYCVCYSVNASGNDNKPFFFSDTATTESWKSLRARSLG